MYCPCTEPDRWFRGHNIADTENWIFLGDFNFYRSISDRNRPGGNIQDTLIFNDAIGHLGLVELPLKGRAFTWSNMQSEPLLEQLDWFFTSVNWTVSYPNTQVIPLAKITSDHIPCKVVIDTKIPRASIFRFENFWAEMSSFQDIVQDSWMQHTHQTDAASVLSTKFKRLRYSLKNWSKQFSNMKTFIANCNTVILHLDALEELRTLYNPEHNLRNILKTHLAALLRSMNTYWKNRYTENRIKFGGECTKFFHAMATITFRKNTIMQLQNDQGVWIQDHESKAGIIWNAFRNRMGVTEMPTMLYNLQSLFTPHEDLEFLVEPFSHEEIDNIVKKMPGDKAPGPDGFSGSFLKNVGM